MVFVGVYSKFLSPIYPINILTSQCNIQQITVDHKFLSHSIFCTNLCTMLHIEEFRALIRTEDLAGSIHPQPSPAPLQP
uniref:Uncharacterized protein n=1 Tax=Oryza brachyantha TaxID=4533 RepID=J3MSP1_ORYBR